MEREVFLSTCCPTDLLLTYSTLLDKNQLT